MTGLTLLGALFRSAALEVALGDQCYLRSGDMERMQAGLAFGNLQILLISSFGNSERCYLFRYSPCYKHPDLTQLAGWLDLNYSSTTNLVTWSQPHRPSDCSRSSSLGSQHHMILIMSGKFY